MKRLLVAPAVLALCLVAGRAQAQQNAAPPDEAVELYRLGRQYYQEGRYAEAATELERALMLDPSSANLAFNVARVYELLGDLDKSIRFYERYLQLLTPEEGEERDRTEGILRRLRGARDARDASVGPAPIAPTVNPGELREPERILVTKERGVADVLFWVTSGIGAGVLVAGGIVGALALVGQDEVAAFTIGRDGALEDRDALVASTNDRALAADVLLIGGGAVLGAGLLLFVLRENVVETRMTPTVALVPREGGALLVVGGAL